MTRRHRLIAASLALFLIGLWAVVTYWVGPAEIARAYRGESLPFFNDLLSGRASHGLQDYLDHWTRLTRRLGWLLAGAIVLGYGGAEVLGSEIGRRGRRTAMLRIRRALRAAPVRNEATDLRLADGLLLSLSIGLTVGAVEGLVQFLNRFVRSRPDFVGVIGPDVVWLLPVAAGAILLVIGAALCLALRFIWPRVLRTSWVLLPLLTLSLFELTRATLPRVAWWAAILMALGVSARAAYMVGRVPRPTVRRLATLSVVVLLVTEVGVATSLRRAESAQGLTFASGRTPSVLLIILDTVRAANLGLYGYERPTTPVLERLGARGIVFDMAFAPASWTLPSHATFFTGRYSYELGIGDWLTPLDGTFPTVAEWFTQHGYATGGFVANMVVCGEQFGLDRGFQHYEAVPVSWRTALWNTFTTRELIKVGRRRFGQHRQFLRKSAEEVNRAFLEWQAEVAQPFFAFLNYFDAHDPYGPPQDSLRAFSAPGDKYWIHGGGKSYDDEDTRQIVNAYDDAIHYIDSQIGHLLEELEQRGILENTVVVITSDHGEEFREHGGFEHGGTLYREVLHVPLVILPPGSRRRGVRVESPVGLSRLAATLVEMAGIADGAPFPGLPLVTPVAGPADEVLPVLSEATAKTSARGEDMFSLIEGGYHYIGSTGSRELYELAADPKEAHDLASTAGAQRTIESMQATLIELTGGLAITGRSTQ